MGFIDINQLNSSTSNKYFSCSTCGLYRNCNSPKMGVTGKGKKGILFIAEAPGEQEDKQGVQLIGKAGKYLRSVLNKLNINLDEDCWKINAINCRPPDNREPAPNEIKACKHMWQQAIRELKPKKVILLGKTAVASFLDDRTTDIGKLDKWVGFTIPDQLYKVWVFPTYHPSYVQREINKKNIVLENRFKEHIQHAIDFDPDPFYVDKHEIEIVKIPERAVEILEKLYNERPKLLSFDWEGTGIKPHRKGHRIKSVAFSWEEYKAYSMLHFPDCWQYMDLLEMVLTDPEIGKTAHGMKFEETWSRVILGYGIKNWQWDSMTACHVLDNRGSISSLKHQTYLRYGIIGYENDIKQYLEGVMPGEDPKNDNHFNLIDKAPIDKLLHYGGLDASYGLLLTNDQKKEAKEKNLLEQINFFLDGIETFVDVEENGWSVDVPYYKKAQVHLKRLDDRNKKLILESNENIKYRKKTGTDINPKSNDQLGVLFHEVLGFEVVKKTKGKVPKPAMDAEVLAALSSRSRVAKAVIEMRKNKGLQDKIKDYLREQIDGIIHPSYNLHIPRSYRSSCNSPNQQNTHKRDEYAKKILRKGIITRPGHMIVSRDYSGVEVSTSCCYHKDPEMIAYQKDRTTDMHWDMASLIYFLPERSTMDKKEVKPVRHEGKNKFVFPQFYGDYWMKCTLGLWERVFELTVNGVLLIDHLADNGIRTYKDFEQHIKEIEEWFWGKKFRVYNDWKEDYWDKYQTNGYVEFLNGFRCTDVLTKNEAINRPIQGTAFHLLLWSFIQTHWELVDGGFDSMLIGQIHDDMLADVHPDEFDDYIKLTDRIEKIDIVKHWPWINVPLDVETEYSDIDGNWYSMKELKNI